MEQSRVWVTNPRNHPEHIEFLRYEPDSTVPEVIKANPHIAFRVDDAGGASEAAGCRDHHPALRGGRLPRVVFVRKYNTIFEYMQYLKEGWFGHANHELPRHLYLCLGPRGGGCASAVDGVPRPRPRHGDDCRQAITPASSCGRTARPARSISREDGTVYFKPDPSRYGAIKPVAEQRCSASAMMLRELMRRADAGQCLAGAAAQHAARHAAPARPRRPMPSATATSTACALRTRMRAPMRSGWCQ